jgi:hypothetical protein
MMQAHPVPDMDARDGLPIECMTSRTVALLCTRERANKIDLRAGIDNPADAAKNSIHFSKCAKSIDVNRLQARCLRQQFLVAHFENPRRRVRGHQNTEMSGRRQKCEMQPSDFSAQKVDVPFLEQAAGLT